MFHQVHLPIIERPRKQTPTPPLHQRVPNLHHPLLFGYRQSIQRRERVTQNLIPAPFIFPKSNSSTTTHKEHNVVAQQRTFFPNLLLQSHSKPLSPFPSMSSSFNSILSTNNFLPKSLPFFHEAPTPFTQEGPIKRWKASNSQTSLIFLWNNLPLDKMSLLLQSPSSPKEVPLDLLKSQSSRSRHTKKRHVVDRHVGKSTPNGSESPSLRNKLTLPQG